MPLIEWTDAMSVGVAEFDLHHKRIIELLNKVHASTEEGTEQQVTGIVLIELSNYTMYHFFAEEEAMRSCGYQDYEKHRREHIELTDKTLGMVEDMSSGRQVAASELGIFLRDWLRHHILETDMQYRQALNACGYR